MPAARHSLSAPFMACAVSAMIGNMLAAGFLLADFSRRFVAIHDWHLAIHENRVVSAALPGFECGLSVGRDVDAIAEFLENAARDFLVHDVVFGQQNMVRLALALRAQGVARHDWLRRHAPALCLRAEHHHEAIGQIAMRHRLQQVAREPQFAKTSARRRAGPEEVNRIRRAPRSAGSAKMVLPSVAPSQPGI